jgi:hypothetical protein
MSPPRLMAKQANGPMVIVVQKIYSGGHAAMLRLSIGPTATQTQIRRDAWFGH